MGTAIALTLVISALGTAVDAAERPPVTVPVVDMGQVKSNLDQYGWKAGRDCGYSEPSPAHPGQSLWVFCDTGVTRPDGTFYDFFTSTAAIGPDTPGAAPEALGEIGFWGVPSQFLPESDLVCDWAATHTPSWTTGMTRLPKTSKLLITYTSLCVDGSRMQPLRFGIAEYDTETLTFTNDSRVFSAEGGVSSPPLGLGNPVINGGYLYLYTSRCQESYVACTKGDVFVARIALGRYPDVTRPWGDPSRYRWWNGKTWVADHTAAASIIKDSGAIAGVSVDWYPQRNRYVMIEHRSIGGEIRIWDARKPQGPWTRRADAQIPCVPGPAWDWFCRAIIAHPELSTSATSLGISFYNTGDGRVHAAMIDGLLMK